MFSPPMNIGGRLIRMVRVGVLAALTSTPLMASTTWYVDNANPACTNSGPGDALKPFCTIQTAAKKAHAGDKVLVSPGDYREQVTLRSSGSPGSPIVFQATGPRTTVLGSIDISRPDTWRRASNNAWRRSLDTAPRQVFVDGVRLTQAPGADDTTANSFFYDASSQRLYVDIGGPNPGLDHLVEAGSRTYGFNIAGVSNIVVEGFELKHQNSACVRAFQTSGITLQDLSTELAGTYGIRIDSCTEPVLVKTCRTAESVSNGIVVVASTGVTLQDNRSHHNGFHGISLQSSSRNVVMQNVSYSNFRWNVRSATGIDLSNDSEFNTVTANTTYRNQDSGIQVYSGSDNNLVARNVSWGNGDHGFDTNDSTGTRYVNNTSVRNYKDGFSVEGGSRNTTLSNNIAADNGLTTNEFELFVDPLSSSGFSSDFDLLWKSGVGRVVKANGAIFTTLNEFRQATNNEDHGIAGDPQFVSAEESGVLDLRLSSGSAAIDSANSGASGFVSNDRSGFGPADDPQTSNTGSGSIRFADRGAFEFDPAPIADLRVSPSSGEIDFTVTANASRSTDDDETPIESYTFDFGDGAVVGPQASPLASHTYTIPGSFRVVVTVTDERGNSSTDNARVTALDHAPGARLSVNPSDGVIDLPVVADASASSGTNFTPIVSYTFDFGDGTIVGPQAGATAPHTYTVAGDYTVTVTVTNAAGDSSTATSDVSVRDEAPIGALSVTPSLGITNLTVTADASGSIDADATPIASYTFDFGDGTIVGPQASPVATHTYTTAGDFTVVVTVTDAAGKSGIAMASVRAVVNSAPVSSLVVTPTIGRKPLDITVDASGSTDTDPAPIATYTFDFGDGTVVGPQASPTATHLYRKKGKYNVSVTVTDTAGLSSTATQLVTVKKKGHRRH